MSTKSYSNVNTIQKQKEYLSRRLDKYAKFYWRGEDMWETYSTFITNNGSALKFVNGPSFSNEYSSPQYDHAMGNLTGVKFSRMQVSFTICTYGVTAAQYRSLIAALGPYEIDYLAFDYDDKLCYLAKTTGIKEGQKTVIGVDNYNNDLYMVENNITFEVQGEQCALAQRQYVWAPKAEDEQHHTIPITPTTNINVTNDIIAVTNVLSTKTEVASDMLQQSEKPYGVVGEIRMTPMFNDQEAQLDLYISDIENPDLTTLEDAALLCHVVFNKITYNWQNTEVDNNADPEQNPQPTSFENIDNSFSIKYDSASGLVFMQYGESDYKILDLLLTNTYGEYIIKNMSTTKMKIDKRENADEIYFIWKLTNFNFIGDTMQPICIGNFGNSGSCYLKKIKIDNSIYTFGDSGDSGNYRNIPGLVIVPGLNDEDVVDNNNGYTQIKPGAYLKFPCNANKIEVQAYQGADCWYKNSGQSDAIQMGSTDDPHDEWYELTLYKTTDHIDKRTVQTYGRAKTILV